MRQLMIRATALFAATFLSGFAMAADFEETAPGKSTYDWRGSYVGLQAGGGFTSDAISRDSLGGVSNPEDLSGFVGGVLYGYNFQRGKYCFRYR